MDAERSRSCARPRRRTGRSTPSIVAFTDMQGRLQGKRCTRRYFLDEVLPHGTEACNYLLAVDVDMNTVDGYAMSSWERGYGDFVLRPDLATLRLLPWQPGTALVHVRPAVAGRQPRSPPRPGRSWRRQLERLAERGWTALAGTELEFMVFRGHLRAGLGTRLPRA